MQNISIRQDETDSSQFTQRSQGPVFLPPSPSSGSNLVAQAAAHVASRFRKLRDLNFGRTQSYQYSCSGFQCPVRGFNEHAQSQRQCCS